MLVEKKVSKKANLEICKELFDLMNWFSMEYNTADTLNKLMMEGGEGFDEIHFALTGERIKSKPSDLNIQIPNTYLDLLTPKERTRLEKIFIK
ncbi:MAG: hypothetical protein IH886_01860 [Nitrospinae bacterium]|nr:hypothetical protein [Nitrospinota bacterium]